MHTLDRSRCTVNVGLAQARPNHCKVMNITIILHACLVRVLERFCRQFCDGVDRVAASSEVGCCRKLNYTHII